jgi:hypothetical protein
MAKPRFPASALWALCFEGKSLSWLFLFDFGKDLAQLLFEPGM